MTDSSVDPVDLLIFNASIIDGTGSPRFKGAVALRADKIVGVYDELQPNDICALEAHMAFAKLLFDAQGMVLSPGFIDAHTHDDRLLLSDPQMMPKLSQGITTVIVGNCGISLAPMPKALSADVIPPLNLLDESGAWFRFKDFASYVDALKHQPAAINCALLVGHTTLRVAAVQDLNQEASEAEISVMREQVREALKAGAIGVSTGLYYEPAKAASTHEVIEVCRPLTELKGVYCTHMRDEAEGLLTSLDESFLVGRELDAPVIISHLKVVGVKNYGQSPRALAHIQAHQDRQEICFDCYPYPASSTILSFDRAVTASRVIVTWSKAMPEMAGKDLSHIAQKLDLSEEEAIKQLDPAGAIYFRMDESDVQTILSHPQVMIGSDGLPHDEFPHPRLWGSFTKVLGHYSRTLGLFPLESAIRKMTSITAKNFRLVGRGQIRVGYYADLTLFDPEEVDALSSYERPVAPSRGIRGVWVNGVKVYQDGHATGRLSGQVLSHQDRTRDSTSTL
jgi:N-acyl-D-amino-acid deacylase